MKKYLVINKNCVYCNICFNVCIQDAVKKINKKIFYINNKICTLCFKCINECPILAIKVVKINNYYKYN